MDPSQAHGPSAGPAEANSLPETHGLPKVHVPRDHCAPCPLSAPLAGPVALWRFLQHLSAKYR